MCIKVGVKRDFYKDMSIKYNTNEKINDRMFVCIIYKLKQYRCDKYLTLVTYEEKEEAFQEEHFFL